VKGAGAASSKKANKDLAKASDASLKTRANAAKEAVVDKKDEAVHDIKADSCKGRRSLIK
jgi:Glucose-repressible protein Grg1